MSPRARRSLGDVERVKRVRKRRVRPTNAQVQAGDLGNAPIDHDALRRQTYLTVAEAMAYLSGFPTRRAFYEWVRRRGVPKCHANGLRFRRTDLDKTVQPAMEA